MQPYNCWLPLFFFYPSFHSLRRWFGFCMCSAKMLEANSCRHYKFSLFFSFVFIRTTQVLHWVGLWMHAAQNFQQFSTKHYEANYTRLHTQKSSFRLMPFFQCIVITLWALFTHSRAHSHSVGVYVKNWDLLRYPAQIVSYTRQFMSMPTFYSWICDSGIPVWHKRTHSHIFDCMHAIKFGGCNVWKRP